MNSLLEVSAEMSRLMSDECDGCNWYHGLWQTFRLLNVVVSAEQHRDYYERQLNRIRPESVVITGTSDYAMLDIVNSASPDALITVIDQCKTPLQINEWYAKKMGFEIDTIYETLLNYYSLPIHDVVMTDCLFTFIAPEDRVAVVRKWRSILKDGGRFIMVNRLREKDDEEKSFTDEEKCIFLQKIIDAPEIEGIGKGFLVWCGQQFVNNFRYYHADESIVDLFLDNGFEVEDLQISGENTDNSAPSTTGDARRIFMTMRAV